VSTTRDTAVEGSTLKGNKAQESIGRVAVATQWLATDLDMEKGLEVEAWAAGREHWWRHGCLRPAAGWKLDGAPPWWGDGRGKAPG